MPILKLIRRFRSPTAAQRPGRRDRAVLAAVHAAWRRLEPVSDRELLRHVDALRSRVASPPGRRPEGPQLTETLALAAEAVRRATGKRYYDVQLLGGIVLARGCVAEMQTGEGKTLTTLLPAATFALQGRGVHVATTNGYLAQRDCEELRPALALLGLTAGLLPEEHDESAKRQAYRQDVTFGTGYDFGFDFLRDQIALRARDREPLGARLFARMTGRGGARPEPLQRPPACAIIDEADSVLIDEGTMPLILSAPTGEPASRALLQRAAEVARSLTPEVDVDFDIPRRRFEFTAVGWQKLHAGQADIRAALRRPWAVYVENALRAERFLQRDVDYVVRDGAVQIVDPQTGRIHAERSWRDGLHQAVELLAAVEPTAERAADARVTRQRCFQRYPLLAGMTGTAGGVEAELQAFYRLPTVGIPTHRPCQRKQHPTRCFGSAAARDAAVVADAVAASRAGRPVLIGTRTILHSRLLSARLREAGLSHELLNGVQDRAEAEIVAQAGLSGAVTIATNMAGRGTDIRLDDRARAAGGLQVIAAEHHPSRRVDRQLAGRAGRQGDPGSSQVFASADDELFALADSDLPARLRAACDAHGEAHVDCAREIRALQERLEQQGFAARREMVRRDLWLDGILESLAGQGEP